MQAAKCNACRLQHVCTGQGKVVRLAAGGPERMRIRYLLSDSDIAAAIRAIESISENDTKS